VRYQMRESYSLLDSTEETSAQLNDGN